MRDCWVGVSASDARAVGLFRGEAGAADYDPLGQLEESAGLPPAAEVEEAVGADDDEETCAGELVLEGGQGVDGVVGGAVGTGGVEGGGGEARVGRAGEGSHGESVGEAGGGVFGLEGLAAGGGKEDLIEGEGVCSGGRDGEVAVVDGVERAAKEGYPHDGFRVA